MSKFRLIWENITFAWKAIDMVLQKQAELECRLDKVEGKQSGKRNKRNAS